MQQRNCKFIQKQTVSMLELGDWRKIQFNSVYFRLNSIQITGALLIRNIAHSPII